MRHHFDGFDQMVGEADEKVGAAETVVKNGVGKRVEARKGAMDVSLRSPASDSNFVYAKHNFDFRIG